MKNTLMIAVLLLLLTGCYRVVTYYPLYNEKDLFPNDMLLGIWHDKDSVLWKFDFNTIDGKIDSTAYILSMSNQDSSVIDWKTTGVEAHLLKIKDGTFIDLYAYELNVDGLGDEKLFPYFVVPFHLFAKIEVKNDSVSLFWPNTDWISEMAKRKKLKLDYHIKEDDHEMSVCIFSKTDKLQKFVAKYVNDKRAFEEDSDNPALHFHR
jgi:hypothetical protein